MTDDGIGAVVFDMGGVIMELGPLDELLGAGAPPPDAFWPRWLASPAVRAFERGDCDAERFARDLVAELGLSLSAEELLKRFAQFPVGLYSGAVELVESVRPDAVTALLSNTNPLHWSHQADGEIVRSLFDRTYLSFRLGLLKPDRAIFDHVVEDLALPARRILLIDDNRINVEAARAAGLRAEAATGPAEAAEALARHGLPRR